MEKLEKKVPMKSERYLNSYVGNSDPRRYKNTLYSNPLLHKNGYHERHYLLKGKEYFIPMYFDRPYYIEQCTLNDTITRSDLARKNPNNSHVLANRLNDYGKYSYQQEVLYQDKMAKEDIKFAKVEKKNEYIANKSVLQKEGFIRAVERNDKISNKSQIPTERPVFKDESMVIEEPVVTNTIVYETVPSTSTSQILIPEETIITETKTIEQPILEKQTTTTTTTTTTTASEQGSSNIIPPQETIVPQLQKDETPIFKEEVILVPHIEEDNVDDSSNQQLSYSEITQVPVHMTSSEFGGNNNSGSSGRRGKKGKKQQYRKEIITKKSTDGGKSWTNDSNLAGDNVEFIEEQTTIKNQ
ncbi:hypothetical protein ACTA71_003839 [Dictyostelium dimigraforme]